MYPVNLKKRQRKPTPPKWLRRLGANPLFEFLRFSVLGFSCFRFDKAQRHQYSTFDVGRSMFDVQSLRCAGQTEFHISDALHAFSDYGLFRFSAL